MLKQEKKESRPKLICAAARKAAMPSVIKPMLATLVDAPFSNPEWLFETKLDGVRAISFITNGKARFISRNQIEMTAQYPELADIAKTIRGSSVILDGEIVALDKNGVSRFQLLQPRLGRKNAGEIERLAATTRIAFYVFDLLYLDGFDLTGCALIDRKTTLEQVLDSSRNIRFSDHIIGEGKKLYEKIVTLPLEGMIAKRLESVYTQRRSADWLKIKTIQHSEVVVGGYTESRSSREYFGALVVGLYRNGKLQYVAHAGGGFNDQTLAQIYKLMQPLKSDDCPFLDKPKTNGPVQWVKPRLVAQVKFSEWTHDERMRQPVFLGLRQDKNPEDCVFEAKRDSDGVVAKKARKPKD
jgi:bifunctional non-homologous end joining protein LigD